MCKRFGKYILFTYLCVMIGRPAQHSFNSLEIGQKTKLKGKAAKYPHQFANQYNKKDGRKVKVIKEGKNYFIERIL